MSILNTLIRATTKDAKKLFKIHAAKDGQEETSVAIVLPLQAEIEVEEVPAITEEVPAITIESFFEERNISISYTNLKEPVPAVEELAVNMALNYKLLDRFIKHLRDAISKKTFKVNFTPTPQSEQIVKALAKRFSECGIMSSYFFNEKTGYIIGEVSSCPTVINFINGRYLEIFCNAVLKKVLTENSKKYNVADYEMKTNVIITKNGKTHEIDSVFRLGDKVFWLETKSGAFSDYNRYREVGLLLGVNPNRHILLNAEVTENNSSIVEWLYDFYVSDIATLKDKLNTMIGNTFKEDTTI